MSGDGLNSIRDAYFKFDSFKNDPEHIPLIESYQRQFATWLGNVIRELTYYDMHDEAEKLACFCETEILIKEFPKSINITQTFRKKPSNFIVYPSHESLSIDQPCSIGHLLNSCDNYPDEYPYFESQLQLKHHDKSFAIFRVQDKDAGVSPPTFFISFKCAIIAGRGARFGRDMVAAPLLTKYGHGGNAVLKSMLADEDLGEKQLLDVKMDHSSNPVVVGHQQWRQRKKDRADQVRGIQKNGVKKRLSRSK